MGKSFYWIDKSKIASFYDKLVLVATNSSALAKPSFHRLTPEVQAASGIKSWIVYDQKNFWYELEEGVGGK